MSSLYVVAKALRLGHELNADQNFLSLGFCLGGVWFPRRETRQTTAKPAKEL